MSRTFWTIVGKSGTVTPWWIFLTKTEATKEMRLNNHITDDRPWRVVRCRVVVTKGKP